VCSVSIDSTFALHGVAAVTNWHVSLRKPRSTQTMAWLSTQSKWNGVSATVLQGNRSNKLVCHSVCLPLAIVRLGALAASGTDGGPYLAVAKRERALSKVKEWAVKIAGDRLLRRSGKNLVTGPTSSSNRFAPCSVLRAPWWWCHAYVCVCPLTLGPVHAYGG
jgi:hypothetical protein